ncbi:hypothetical protein ABIE26_004226 [Pedobacter africanus]|uniref:Uncharacterized protein n=1 Tax=Pedobacter africanus TaxID=151894 RepID=A0ACC6L205_9SPHI|nr:DUF4843 domain-containing protein [Pedobacter africanus]MDR6785516.1 hypothetical protein [Pedobacter africanus]
MKKRIIYLGMLLICLAIACKEANLSLYDDEASKTSIYFPFAESASSMNLSFGYSKSNVKDSVIRIVVRIIGAPKNFDRPYGFSVADSSTLKEGEHYKILGEKRTIAAGKVADTIKMQVFRKESLRKDSLFLYLDLKPNANFTNNYLNKDITVGGKDIQQYYTRMRIKVDDIAGPPPFWLSPYGSYTEGYLGKFSALKLQLLITRFNLDVNEVIQPAWFTSNGNYTRMGPWSDNLKAYLKAMSDAGTPVYEADNKTLMTMGPNAK